MSSSSTVLEDGSRLSLADRAYLRIESVLNLAGGIIILSLVLLAVMNVAGRKFLNLPVSGYIDWVEQAMAFFAFLGISYCQRSGGHIGMDIVIGALKGRILWFAELVSVVFMFLLTLILIYGSALHAWRAFDIGDSSFDIELPTWPSKLVVTVALTVLAGRLILQLWGYMRAVKQGGDSPVAVPLIEDAEAQAAHEAETVSGFDEEKA